MNKIEFYSNLAKFEGRNSDAFLKHYGIIGQKWGQRRWQNADGTFNEEGKQRYFGKIGSSNKTDKMLEKTKKKADKINAKIEKAVESRLKHPLIYNTKGVNEDELRKFFTAYYNTPFYKRDAKGIEKTFNDLYDSEINSKMINNIKDAENAQWMHRQAVQQHQQFVNQINLQNHLNIHNQMVMNHMHFMGKPNKKQKEEQKELNKEIKELTNNIETSFNIPDKFKEYNKEITDQVNAQIAYMIRSNPGGELPKKIDVNISDDGRLKIDFAYDDNDQKIGGLFNKTPEEKEFKEAKRLVQQLNFDNGTRVLKELRNSEYGKKHIQPIYNEYEENMNKLGDKVEKIIKDNPVDEIEAGIANALFKAGTNKTSITDIIESVRGQHYSSSFDEPINTERLPLLKSDEDLWTDMINYKKEFGNKIEKEFKNIYPKAKTALSYYIALSDYENDKLEKVYSMNDEEYRKYQLYYLMDGLVPEVNKKIIKKDVIEPTNKLYPKVEKIINNTNAGDPSYNWSDINNALSKLGLDSKPADELTNADWKKVYEICSQ